jgi:hypothetical protein
MHPQRAWRSGGVGSADAGRGVAADRVRVGEMASNEMAWREEVGGK